MEEKQVQKTNETLTFSFGDLFRNLRNKWKITLLVGLVTLIVACSGLMFVSHGKNTYVSKFQADWPGIGSEKYPNGRPFKYKQLVSLENLEKVKNSNDEFKNIDVVDMFNENAITLEYIPEEKINGKPEFGYNYFYTLTIKQSYFANKNQAIQFVRQIVETDTFNKAKDEISNYKILNYFDNQTDKTEYPEMLSNITQQISLQKSILDAIISQSSPDFVFDEENNKTLAELRSEYNAFLTYNDYSRFELEMKNNKYVRNLDTFRDEFQTRLDTINLEIEKNNRKIIALKDLGYTQVGQDNVPQMIADLTLRNEDLKWQKEYIEECLASPNTDTLSSSAFEAKVLDYQNTVTSFNKALELAYREVYEPKVMLEYDENKIIKSEGMGFLKIGVFGIVLTVVVEFILSLILTYSINKKRLENN